MWARFLSAAVGIWLMAAPAVLGHEQTPAEANDRIVGPLIASFAIVAMWEIGRSLRYANTVLGAWLLISPWIFGFGTAQTVNEMVCGAAVVGASLVRGKLTHSYGGGWSSLLPGRSTEPPLPAKPSR